MNLSCNDTTCAKFAFLRGNIHDTPNIEVPSCGQNDFWNLVCGKIIDYATCEHVITNTCLNLKLILKKYLEICFILFHTIKIVMSALRLLALRLLALPGLLLIIYLYCTRAFGKTITCRPIRQSWPISNLGPL